MRTLLIILSLIVSIDAQAYKMGDAPFCLADSQGNLKCYYYDLNQCRIDSNYVYNSMCVPNHK